MARVSVTHGVSIAGLVAWLLLPVAGLVALSVFASQANISADVQPVWVPLQSAGGATSEPIDIALQWEIPPPLLAPDWSGVIQTVAVSHGDSITDGSPIVTVNGVVRIAVASPAPFYRPISRGVKGADVEWLNDFLSASGRSHGTGPTVSAGTMGGIAQLARDLGADDTRVFDPGWVVFLGSAGLVVDSVDLLPGGSAPALGTAIIASVPSLARATSVKRGSLDVFRSDGSQPQESRRQLSDAIVVANAKRVAVGSHIEVSGKVLNVVDDRSALDPESLSAVAAMASPTMNVLQGNLVRPQQDGDLIVPSAAVVAGADGGSCVVVGRGDGTSVVAIEVVADVDGQVVIRAPLSTSDRVQVPPNVAARACA